NIYEIPLIFAKEGLDSYILKRLALPPKKRQLGPWRAIVNKMNNFRDEVSIGLVGKYAGLQDSYLSLKEALIHGGLAHGLKVNIIWIEAENLERGELHGILRDKDGILVPGGFGVRGIEGKIRAVTYARENMIPYFGICLGMQCATIEFTRNVVGLAKANSTEFDAATPHKIFFLWRELRPDHDLGGTMRLGHYACCLEKNSLAHRAYRKSSVWERHRHRYEFNPAYEARLAVAGLFFSGRNPEHNLVEIVELRNHPWFLGCQFHPEFQSKPLRPHPLFRDFIGASYAYRLHKAKGRKNR
ncbi:MAG: CTP synthase, partial [Acidobacteriota bacterium]